MATKMPMTLAGDENIPAMPLKESEVNHLRQLLAWMRVEYTLDEHMQRGILLGAQKVVEHGAASQERVSEIVQAKADEINQVPAYVRQAHKMLSKALRKHEAAAGMVDVAKN
jgi:hypothetical protein